MMDKEYLSKLNHDLCFRPGIILEALEKGVQFGTKEFFVYSQLRWYETDGKFGFCVAGNERLGEDVGMTEKEVEWALRRLNDAGLVEHVWCDKKVYRNKTKLWISVVRLAGVCTNVDAIRVLKKGKKNVAMLGETVRGETKTTRGSVETTRGSVGASPVTTGVGNTNRNTNRNNNNNNSVMLNEELVGTLFDIGQDYGQVLTRDQRIQLIKSSGLTRVYIAPRQLRDASLDYRDSNMSNKSVESFLKPKVLELFLKRHLQPSQVKRMGWDD